PVRIDSGLRQSDVSSLENPVKLDGKPALHARQRGHKFSRQCFEILFQANEVRLFEGRVVDRIDVQPDLLKNVAVEQIIRSLSGRMDRQTENPNEAKNKMQSIPHHETSHRNLQPEDTGPESRYSEHGLPFNVCQFFALGIELNLEKSIQVPGRSQSPHALAVRKYGGRSRTPGWKSGAGIAVER